MRKVTKDNILRLKPFFENAKLLACDYSIGVKLMWKDYFDTHFYIYKKTLIIMENYEHEKYCFYYPMGPNPELALDYIETVLAKMYSNPSDVLEFCCLSEEKLAILQKRYPGAYYLKDRKWSDYIYEYHDLLHFKGGKYAGQRNHINKFKTMYPNHDFKIATIDELERIKRFLDEYCLIYSKLSDEARYENMIARTRLREFFELGLIIGYLEVDSKIVAVVVGEIVGDILYVHIEKANRNYQGVYPMVVQKFLEQFIDKGITYVNREEDCNDPGLRTSKLQYHPCLLQDKYFLCHGNLVEPLRTKRLTLRGIQEKDIDLYYQLSIDHDLNQYWGYDFRKFLNGEEVTKEYFYYQVVRDYLEKETISYMICLNDQLIGEGVLDNLHSDFAEIGIRLLPRYHHLGYGTEAFKALIYYCLLELKKHVIAKCYKANYRSKKLLDSCLPLVDSDDNFYYYQLNGDFDEPVKPRKYFV